MFPASSSGDARVKQLCTGVLLDGNALNQDGVQAVHLEHRELIVLFEKAPGAELGGVLKQKPTDSRVN